MDAVALQKEIDAATAYERLHVPALFGQWVGDVLSAAEVGPGESVLDVACGTGVLARAALAEVGEYGRVVGVDPNPGMLAVAGELEPAVDWRAGAAEDLPLEGESFDAVVSQFGLMFFADRELAVREMLRVLKPGGRLALAVWDRLDRHPGYAREVDLLERTAGRAAADALRAPFALGESSDLRALLERAGVESPEVETRTGRARFPSVRTMVEADLRGWLPVMGVRLSEPQIEEILTAAERELSEFVTEEGGVAFDAPAHVVAGSKSGAHPA